MKCVSGVWLPEGDTHFQRMMQKTSAKRLADGREVGVYQWEKMNLAMQDCWDFRLALDVGAHVGFWSMWLAQSFDKVIAFEPVEQHAQCWERNVLNDNARLLRCGVGAEKGTFGISAGVDNSGNSFVSGDGDIPVIALDSLKLHGVDLIKIDTEGFESAVIQGARETIERNRPILVVESNGQHSRYGLPEPVGLLQSMGAKVLHRMRHDVILGWRHGA